MTKTGLHKARDRVPEQNPFVAISTKARCAIIIYFLIWRIIPASAQMTQPIGEGAAYHTLAVLIEVGVEVLMLLPFIVTRFAGSPVGWVHPLILPAVISILFGVFRSPEQLLRPLAVWNADYSVFTHDLIGGWPMNRVRLAQLKLEAMTLVSLIATYCGFAFLRMRWRPRLQFPILSGNRILALFVLFVLAVFFFLEREGGIISHMTALAGGRFRMRELSGHYLVINNFLPYILILWYLVRPHVLRSPVFLSALALSCVLQFVVIGSRSGLFIPVAAMLSAWMLVNRRVPMVRALLFGIVVMTFLGVLGDVRTSGRDGRVDFSAILEFDFAEQLERTHEQLAARSRETALAVAALVPQEQGYLLGRSYVSAVAFWVPRSIWRDKPRGIGPHVSALLYGGLDTMDGYSGGGYPVNAQAEAYWNFSWPGVIFMFLLFGGATRFLADWRVNAPHNPVAAMVLVVAAFQFGSPSTVSLVKFLQTLTLLAFTVLIARTRRQRI